MSALIPHDRSADYATRLAILRARIRSARVPRATPGKSLVLPTWNIRELGKRPRRPESLHFIAEVLRAFDLTCIIELREDLSDMRGVLRHLGPSFEIVFSEPVRDAGGNRERIAFLYDTRVVEFTGLASHLHPPREKDGNEYLARVSWWRPPYVASFRSGKCELVVAAAHIRESSTMSGRRNEIAMLADWAVRYAATTRTDTLLVGDFNLPSVNSAAFRMLQARGFGVPAPLAAAFGTDLGKKKRYDQILVVPRGDGAEHTQFSGAGGALDFHAPSHRALYPMLNKHEFTFEMSDHLPLWVEVVAR